MGRSAAPPLMSRHIPPLLVAFDSTLEVGFLRIVINRE